MINSMLQYSLYLAILVVLAIPLGNYIGKVMNGEKNFLSKILNPVENYIYKLVGIDKNEEMDWKKYAKSAVGIAVLFALIRGFIIVKGKRIGNFWVDTTRIIVHILIPSSIVVSLLIVYQGVVQNFSSYQEVELLQPITLEGWRNSFNSNRI